MNTSPDCVANHHADHPGFAGVRGLVAGTGMLIRGRRRVRLAVDLAGVSSTDTVVDIGCGPGSAVRAAARRGARVTGVDPAPVMLRLAQTLTPGQPTVTWAQGTAEHLPLADDLATIVWSLATVHHWKDVTAGLAEIRRVLIPGGRFLAIERWVRPDATGLASHGWTDQQVQSFKPQCRDAGFETVSIEKRSAGRHALWVVQVAAPKRR